MHYLRLLILELCKPLDNESAFGWFPYFLFVYFMAFLTYLSMGEVATGYAVILTEWYYKTLAPKGVTE